MHLPLLCFFGVLLRLRWVTFNTAAGRLDELLQRISQAARRDDGEVLVVELSEARGRGTEERGMQGYAGHRLMPEVESLQYTGHGVYSLQGTS